jgi:hypothetical protein
VNPHHSAEQAWEYENGFYLTSGISRLGKALAQYELYKRIVNLPGEILEFGVYKGTSMARLLTFRNLLESPFSRQIIGFDAFGIFPRTGDNDDRTFIDKFEREGGPGYSIDEVTSYLSFKQLANFELIAGSVFDTLPVYLEARPQLRIALLHLDMDVYEPTKFVLELLSDRVVKKGLVMIDDYGTVSGASKAVDEWNENRGLTVGKLPIAHIPAFVEMD